MSKKTSGEIEAELLELQRKYRIMEGDRKSYTEESQNVIRKQRATIDKLKGESERLKQELAFEARYAQASNTRDPTTQEMQQLQETADDLAARLDDEKARAADYDKQIKGLGAKILEQRQRMGGVNSSRENTQMITKQIRILENRLDKALVKFNEALSHNRGLRDKIDNLRRERVVFDGIYKKMERELHDKKKEMAGLIEEANLAYESRDQAQAEIAQLRASSEKERAAFETEWKELGKLIEKDKKIRDFMKLKERERASNDPGEKAKGGGARGGRADQQVALERVQSYEEAFAKIQQATGISDIDELVSTFINAEDQNFSLFNFVNELNNEIEKLEEQIAEIRSEIEKYRGQGVNTDNQRKKILQDLEERLARTQGKSEQYENRYNAAMKTMNALKNGIHSIFLRIGCNSSAVSDMLGNQGVTESNMMSYLGIIEQRTNEILHQYAQIVAQQQQQHGAADAAGGAGGAAALLQPGSVSSLLGAGPQTAAGSTAIHIQPPSTGEDLESDDDSLDDEDERPLTRDELKAKTVRGLNRQGRRRGKR
jgi:chromosome segregation ATPase